MRRAVVAILLLVMVSPAAAEKLPKGLWQPLVKSGNKWTLGKLTISVTAVRKVGAADVATLDWECQGDESCSPHHLPTQIAVSSKGIYFFDEDAKDDDIVKELKKKPLFTDPPKAGKPYTRRDGTFAVAPKGKKGAMCVGVGAEKVDDDVGCGAAPCYQWMCLDASGVIGAGGLGEGADFGFDPKLPQ